MSLLTASVEALNRGLVATGGERVVYRRGNGAIDALDAVPGQVRLDDYGGEEISLTGRERDWIVWAADLVLAGVAITPARGDLIDWIDPAGVTHSYEVAEREEGRAYRHTDQTMQTLRIYTHEVMPTV